MKADRWHSLLQFLWLNNQEPPRISNVNAVSRKVQQLGTRREVTPSEKMLSWKR